MKVYVDELPKDCWECPCFRNDIDFPCGLGDGTQDYFLDEIDGGKCPLKSLADYTKQVREEVVNEIREKVKGTIIVDLKTDGNLTTGLTLEKILKEVEQGETK